MQNHLPAKHTDLLGHWYETHRGQLIAPVTSHSYLYNVRMSVNAVILICSYFSWILIADKNHASEPKLLTKIDAW